MIKKLINRRKLIAAILSGNGIKLWEGVTHLSTTTLVKPKIKVNGEWYQTPVTLEQSSPSKAQIGIMGKTYQNLIYIQQNTSVPPVARIYTKMLKAETVYTIFLKTSNIQYSGSNGSIYVFYYPTVPTVYIPAGGDSSTSLREGLFIDKITTKTEIPKMFDVALHTSNSIPNGDGFTIDYCMILEGDHTQDPNIPSYFEGIVGVGDKVEGGYKVEAQSVGKNLLNVLNNDGNYPRVFKGITLDFDKKTQEFIINGTVTETVGYQKVMLSPSKFFDIRKNAKYTFSSNIALPFTIQLSQQNVRSFMTLRKNQISTSNVDNSSHDYSENTINYIMLWDMVVGDIFNNFRFKLQIEENTVATSYEPHESSTTQIILQEPLMQLPNGVADEILENGSVVRRVGKVVLDGSEIWSINGGFEQPNTLAFYTRMNSLEKETNKNIVSCMSNNFIDLQERFGSSDIEGIRTNYTIKPESILYIRISKNKLITQDTNGFKQWLQNNPTTVYYELADAPPMPTDYLAEQPEILPVVETKRRRRF